MDLNVDWQGCVIKTVAYSLRTDGRTDGRQTDRQKFKNWGTYVLSIDLFYFKTVIPGGPTMKKYITFFLHVISLECFYMHYRYKYLLIVINESCKKSRRNPQFFFKSMYIIYHSKPIFNLSIYWFSWAIKAIRTTRPPPKKYNKTNNNNKKKHASLHIHKKVVSN